MYMYMHIDSYKVATSHTHTHTHTHTHIHIVAGYIGWCNIVVSLSQLMGLMDTKLTTY